MRVSLLIVATCLIAGTAIPVIAQDKGKKPKTPPKKKPIQNLSFHLDLLLLTKRTNKDGVETVKELGKSHQYGLCGQISAPGKTRIVGTYQSLVNTLISVKKERAVGDLVLKLQSGRLLSTVTERGEGRITSKRPLEKLLLSLRLPKLNKAIKALPDKELKRQIAPLNLPPGLSSDKMRQALAKSKTLAAMKEIEKALVIYNALDSKKARAHKLKMDSKGGLIKQIAGELEAAVKAELWWSCDITYSFLFRRLGAGARDHPTAAFTPGSLRGKVGAIHLQCPIKKGAQRILWFHLKGYKNDEHLIENLKAPKDWLQRLFLPGSGSGGAYLFIKVPSQAEGHYSFLWRRKDASGERMIVVRPPSSKFPF